MKIAVRPKIVLAVGLGFFALVFYPFRAALSGPAAAARWSIDLTLDVTGQYRVIEKDGSLTGRYSFTIHWVGSIDRDEDDWRLVHKTCDVLNWKAEESPAPRSGGKALTTEDFPDKPVFRFHYLLQEQDEIQLDFELEGFEVPLNPSQQKFPLILPVSARTTRPHPGLDYDRHIIKGSNHVDFAASELDNAPIEKTFAWSWRRFQSTLETDATVGCHQSHDARLTVVFKPA